MSDKQIKIRGLIKNQRGLLVLDPQGQRKKQRWKAITKAVLGKLRVKPGVLFCHALGYDRVSNEKAIYFWVCANQVSDVSSAYREVRKQLENYYGSEAFSENEMG
ncbi:hypothetical protein [Endozoicomonas numazuensis]|uniref:Uncharacterized protein n=1 Tax=Endozoicomonas numazuensis TaxID=1137799 RepID=A0A081NEC8_9GAMM|nr:hypothetical protein [Endozoicomonas numazuensis]KEQ16801.1 hypothetical protein GZ78_19185 [Endozoicomonas numazuensis]